MTPTVVALDADSVEAVAQRVVELLRPAPAGTALVDAATLATALGVSREAIYRHARELGGHRVGDGPRGRWRFDLEQALAAWTSCSDSRESQVRETPASKPVSRPHRRRATGSAAALLPIRGPKLDLFEGSAT